MASMNRSSSCLPSVSVGSIMSAPCTISGKADGVGMEAVIDQPLGDVAGAHALLRLAVVAEHHLVHVGRFVRQVVIGLQHLADVVGVEHRIHGGVAQAVAAVRQDVGQRAHQHAEVAVERAHLADGSAAGCNRRPSCLAGAFQARDRQERLQDASSPPPDRRRDRRRRAAWRTSCAG